MFSNGKLVKPDQVRGCEQVRFDSIKGIRTLNIWCWTSSKDPALGRFLVCWEVLSVLCCTFGGPQQVLLVLSLAILQVLNAEEIDKETFANNKRDYGKRKGYATSHYDLTCLDQPGMMSGSKKTGFLQGVVSKSNPQKFKKILNSPKRRETKE